MAKAHICLARWANDRWQIYVGDIGWLFKITRWLELCFWPTRKWSQPPQSDFFTRIALKHEPSKMLVTAAGLTIYMTYKLNVVQIYRLCLIIFYLLFPKPKLENIYIYSNTFFHKFHFSKSSFTCPRLWSTGLAWRLDFDISMNLVLP